MVYGHYISGTNGVSRFFVEGCSCCQISTGGFHESDCPMKDTVIPDMSSTVRRIIGTSSFEPGDEWQYLANH